jgi:hypothetical protein
MWDHVKFTIYNIHQVLILENISLISKPTKPTKLTIQIIKCIWTKILPNAKQGFSRTPKEPHPNSPSYKQLHVIILATITQFFDATQKFSIKSCISSPLEATS